MAVHDLFAKRLVDQQAGEHQERRAGHVDYYPTAGSAPLIYSLADRGARLLAEHDRIALAAVEWSRKNREAGRPFIEHQIEIVNFLVALQRAVAQRSDVRLIPQEDMNSAASRRPMRDTRHPFALHAQIIDKGITRQISVVPDSCLDCN
jgi:hypothetical protein